MMRIKSFLLFIFIFEKTVEQPDEELHRAETTPIPSATDSLQNNYGYERTFTLTTEGFNTTENYYIYYYDDPYLSFNDEAKANGTDEIRSAKEQKRLTKKYILLASGCTVGAFGILAIVVVAKRLLNHERISNEENPYRKTNTYEVITTKDKTEATCIVVDEDNLDNDQRVK